MRILTAALDDGLNEAKFIVPGLGDYGDRYYGNIPVSFCDQKAVCTSGLHVGALLSGTAGYKEGYWGTDGK